MARQSRPTAPARGHSGSDRPTVTRIGTLPNSAQVHAPRTAWGEIIYQVARFPGEWFRLERPYSNLGNGISSARKAADEHLSGADPERLEFAGEELEDGRVQVYLRLAPEVDPVDQFDVDLFDRFDEADSIFDQVGTVASE